jgi:hypothetical protein
MQPVNPVPHPSDVTQPSPRPRPAWPWWSLASLVMLVLIVLALTGVIVTYAVRPTPAAAFPTAVLITTTPQPAPTQAIAASTAPTPITWTNVTRYVRVNGTQGLQLRIRSAPGTQSDTLKLVPDGTRLLILGDGKQVEGVTWWPVRDPSDNKEGWAITTYLVPDAGP